MTSTRLLPPLALIGSLALLGSAFAPQGGGAARPQFGDPLPGLTPVELALFEEGEDEFEEVEDVASGLGAHPT